MFLYFDAKPAEKLFQREDQRLEINCFFNVVKLDWSIWV